ncbi:MAG TPA: O-antigen ligase family protein [Thermoanaerobaculia bacterium]|nr:O-antigen ligase family protein [Thermoanaerobaculia bacterium]
MSKQIFTSWRALRGEAHALEVLAFAILLISLPLLPLPYGAVLPAGMLRIEIVAFTLAVLTFLTSPSLRALRSAAVPILALLGVAILGLLQLLPLPASLASLLSPESAAVYRGTNTVLRLFGVQPQNLRISIAPSDTLQMVLLTVSDVALFTSSLLLLRLRSRRRLFVSVVMLGSLIHIIYGAIHDDPQERMHGAFVNPNHLAGYLEIALSVAFAILWREVLLSRARGEGIGDIGTRLEKRIPPLAAAAILWGAIAIGIGLTRSRGGIGAATITTAVLLTLGITQLLRGRRRRTVATALLATTAAVAFAAATAGHEFLVRFLSSDPREVGADTRLQLWKTSLIAWQHFPLFGSGLGSFREAFRPYQGRELEGLVEQAHSDPLQLLVTGGAVGAFLGILVFGSLLWKMGALWAENPRREDSAILLGGLGAALSLLLHGVAEFNFSIPAIPATLAIVLGCAFAAAGDDSIPIPIRQSGGARLAIVEAHSIPQRTSRVHDRAPDGLGLAKNV